MEFPTLIIEAVGQYVNPEAAVIECRGTEADPWCRRCVVEGFLGETVARRLAHEPFESLAYDEHLRGSAFVFRNPTSYIANHASKAGRFRTALHSCSR